jgi:uncharacterized RDD family membrane protein YckC
VVERSTPSTTATARQLQRVTARTASLGDRLAAVVLDSIVIFGAFAIISIWSFRRWGVSHGDDFHLTTACLLMAGMMSAAVLFLYLWLFEACFGATLGKIIIGIRVARTATSHSALTASAIRNALRIVDGIGFYVVGAIVAGCSQFRQRLGDILAGTIVVEEKFSTGAKLAAVLLWLAALTGAGFGLPRICSGGFSTQPPPYLSGTVVQLGYTADSAYLCISRLRVDFHRDYAPRANGVVTVDSLPR